MKTHLKCLSLVIGAILFLFFCAFLLGTTFKYLFLSFFLAFLLYPFILRLEKFGAKRSIVTIVALILLLALLGFVFSLISPLVLRESKELIASIPDSSRNLYEKLNAYLFSAGIDLGNYIEEFRDKENVVHFIEKNAQRIVQVIFVPFLKVSQKSLIGVVGGIQALIGLFLIPIFFYFLVNSYENLVSFSTSLFPRDERELLSAYSKKVNDIFKGYFQGQLTLSVFLALYLSIALSIAGVKFGILIGLIAGVLNIIPYVGITISMLLSAISVLLYSDQITMGLIIVFAIYAVEGAIEAPFIYPKLVGSKIGLKPLETMLSLAAGMNVGGVFGAPIAVPVYAILRYIFLDFVQAYQKSSFYRQK